jgi:hypothetical protein
VIDPKDWLDPEDEPLIQIAHALCHVARAIQELGTADAATPMGAMEMLAMEVRDGFRALAESLNKEE